MDVPRLSVTPPPGPSLPERSCYISYSGCHGRRPAANGNIAQSTGKNLAGFTRKYNPAFIFYGRSAGGLVSERKAPWRPWHAEQSPQNT